MNEIMKQKNHIYEPQKTAGYFHSLQIHFFCGFRLIPVEDQVA